MAEELQFGEALLKASRWSTQRNGYPVYVQKASNGYRVSTTRPPLGNAWEICSHGERGSSLSLCDGA